MTGKDIKDANRFSKESELVLQAGGTLDPSRHLYIKRKSDSELLELLTSGEYANVLTSRQMGKSSLMAQTVHSLKRLGYSWVSIDIGAELGSKETLEAFYLGFLNAVRRQLSLDLNPQKLWEEHPGETSNQKLMRFFREVAQKQPGKPVVIFIDEIDATLKIDFADDLFVAIRGLYNERAFDSGLNLISFCILGVTSPNELIKDRRTTPYNVGKTIELRDFELAVDDLHPFEQALHSDSKLAALLLERVLFWTDGHPYLTNLLCKEAVSVSAVQVEEIDEIVNRLFSNLQQANGDVHFQQILRFVGGRLTDGSAALRLYRRVLKGEKVKDETTRSHAELKLSGLVKRNTSGFLTVRNRIYEQLFDIGWVDSINELRTAPGNSIPRVLFAATFTSSGLLAIISGYETWQGLLSFMPKGLLGSNMSFLLTFGIHTLLFVISWSIAEKYRYGFLKVLPSVAIWMMTGFFSAYFSFFGFFEATGGRDEAFRQAAIIAESEAITSRIGSEVVQEVADAHRVQLVESEAYKSWVRDVQSLVDTAQQAERQILLNAQIEQQELFDRSSELRERRLALLNQLAPLRAYVEVSRSQLATVREDLATITARTDELQENVQYLTEERNALARQLDAEGQTGQGPRYRQIQIDLNSADARLASAQIVLASSSSSLSDLQEEVIRVETALAADEQNQQVEEIESSIARIDRQLDDLLQSQDEMEANLSFNANSQLQAFAVAQQSIRRMEYAAIDEVAQQCRYLLELVRDTDFSEQLPLIECLPFEIGMAVEAVKSEQARRADFEDACETNKPQFNQVVEGETFVFDPLLQGLEACLSFVEKPTVREEISLKLRELNRDRGDNSSPITQASVALFQDSQSNALMSAVFAIIVDLLVLLTAFVGRNVALPESVRAIDRLVSLTRKTVDLPEGYESYLQMPNDPDVEGLIYTAVRRLIREELAVIEVSETQLGNQRLLLRNGASAYLRRVRSMELAGRQASEEAALSVTSEHAGRIRRSPVEPS